MPKEDVWSVPGKMQKQPPTPPPKPKVRLQSRRSSQRSASAASAAATGGASEPKMQSVERHECNKERSRRQRIEQHRKLQQRLSDLRRQERRKMSDEYLLDMDDNDLYADRINYLHGKRNLRAPMLLNYANTDMLNNSQKTIISYSQESQTPTKDLQALVMVMVHEQIHQEMARLSHIVGEQNPFEMRNMRLNSFISNTPDLIDFWKVAMLDESKRVIEDSLEQEDLSWASPNAAKNLDIPMPVDENMLVLVPADRPEISKSQVAKEYIQAQRGQQADNEHEDLILLFENQLLRSENAAAASPEVFDRIVNCHRLVVQKVTELDYIENKPETRAAVDEYVEELKSGGDDRVVQGLIRGDFDESGVMGRTLVRIVVGQVMDELHAYHKERNFQPMSLLISIQP